MMKEKRCMAAERWQLTEVKTIYEKNNKAVYSAESMENGEEVNTEDIRIATKLLEEMEER
uniref:hypothetical protein n=1 Tax=Acetatifactor sp. TaxID=1872090 RepID=UPI0040579E3C